MLYRLVFEQVRHGAHPTAHIEGPAWRKSLAGPVVPAPVVRWAADEMRARGAVGVEVFSGRPLTIDGRGMVTGARWQSHGVWKAGT